MSKEIQSDITEPKTAKTIVETPTWEKVTSKKRKRDHHDLHDLHDTKQKRIKTPEDPGYLDFRKEARKLEIFQVECFKEAKAASSQNQRQSYEEQGHALTEKIKEANKRAASLILEQNNADNDEFNLDLHGLYVSEALEALQKRLDHLDFPKKARFIFVVTGKGLHSKEGKAKIKPAVLKYLQDNNYRYEEMDHGGQIKIYLKK